MENDLKKLAAEAFPPLIMRPAHTILSGTIGSISEGDDLNEGARAECLKVAEAAYQLGVRGTKERAAHAVCLGCRDKWPFEKDSNVWHRSGDGTLLCSSSAIRALTEE